MSDDSFFREVNEEIRQDRLKALWSRFGPFLIGAAFLLVVGTAIHQVYNYWQAGKANTIGDTFLASFNNIEQNNFDDALKQLNTVEQSDFGGYPYLAQLRKATIFMENGKNAQAVDAFDSVSNDKKAPELLQKVAKIRAAFILVDYGQFEDVEKRVKDLATDIDPMRMSAREALGLAAYKAEKYDVAVYYFKKIVDEKLAGIKTTERAQMMLDMIYSAGKAVKG
ncbi:tetratricopeptide repeat protein [Bartonella tamiae]|uniref:Ancillary SecYEG translocon subunit/Cell division coordinator CpoB TPR domain-containing protein n=1 Tax=Bartonella tamiae Th239 TaxID=1094558 RepID=J1JZE5_9HYPH|nr:tetratricopeptide repeat protein [Bartonella tamiae]EJF90487.1 hypothetical protein ME5_00888 [Bartonella tamiae Th239]EJF93569.1 hypothetical protein MEG_00993 [Bartonella tamiae Th307]